MNPSETTPRKRVLNKAKDIKHHLGVRLGGTKQAEKEWQEKKVDPFYWGSIDHPHRDLLVNSVASFEPTSVLEIGCNTGPNLFRLAQRFPNANLVGIDVSAVAIEAGKRLFNEHGIKNVALKVGKAEDLRTFPDASFDVVFTDAVLIYVDSSDIEKVVDEMVRVASKGVVMVEYQDQEASAKGSFIYKKGYWKRDYSRLLRARKGTRGVTVTRFTREQWNDDYWSTLGALIEVKISHGRE
jgi:ubiquinone/menaquinone biosynthesis C-methylase UbiE